MISRGMFCNLRDLHDLLIDWSSMIVNFTLHTLRSAKNTDKPQSNHYKNFLKSQKSQGVKDILSQRKLETVSWHP